MCSIGMQLVQSNISAMNHLGESCFACCPPLILPVSSLDHIFFFIFFGILINECRDIIS